jgi:hypothetical protein
MTISLAALKAQVRSQKTLIPSLYGGVDFEIGARALHARPQREEHAARRPSRQKYRARKVLANTDAVDRMLAYTMLGDVVADAYAAFIPQYGIRRLIDMLVRPASTASSRCPTRRPSSCASSLRWRSGPTGSTRS